MWHEISQYDIPDRQLLTTKPASSVSRWKDLGEAKVIHTMFGKARVRIIREQDQKRRTRLLTALGMVAVAAAAWQGWVAMNRTTVLPLSARIQVSAPAFQPEYLPNAASPAPVESKPRAPAKTEIIKPVASQKDAPRQALGLKASEQIVKLATPQPSMASKPQSASVTASDSSMSQAGMQSSVKPTARLRLVDPSVVQPPVPQPATRKSASANPLAQFLIKESSPAVSSAGTSHPPAIVNPGVVAPVDIQH